MKEIIINITSLEIRVATLEDGDLVDFLVVCRVLAVPVIVIPKAGKKLSVAVSEERISRFLESFRIYLDAVICQAFLHV